jgi:hypothetical protein
MKIGLAVGEVVAAEAELAESLLEVGERHRAEQDVYHLTRTLARWAQARVAALESFAEQYGADLDSGGPLAAVHERGAELRGGAPDPGVLLLRDLRDLYLRAARTSVAWTMLGQAAQAARDPELLRCVDGCHPETLRTMRWTLTRLKQGSPQILTT